VVTGMLHRPSAAVAPEGMNQLSSSTGDKRHTVKEPTDLEADGKTPDRTASGACQFLSYLVRIWAEMPGSSSLAAVPDVKLTWNIRVNLRFYGEEF